MHSPVLTIGMILLFIVLFVNAVVADRMTNEVNDANAGPYISPFEQGWKRGWFPGRLRAYSLVSKRHKQLFPNSRLCAIQRAIQYASLAAWLGFVAFMVWTDHRNANSSNEVEATQSLSR